MWMVSVQLQQVCVGVLEMYESVLYPSVCVLPTPKYVCMSLQGYTSAYTRLRTHKCMCPGGVERARAFLLLCTSVSSSPSGGGEY